MTGHGEDLANLTANVAKDVAMKTGETVSKAVGNLAKAILEMLLLKLKNQPEKIKYGKTNLEEILKSGQDVKMVDINQLDIKDFTKLSKKYGIQFAVIGNKNKDTKMVTFKASDMERVEKVLENLVEIKMQRESEEKQKHEIKELKEKQRQEIQNIKEQQRQEIEQLKNSNRLENIQTPNNVITDVEKFEFKKNDITKEETSKTLNNDIANKNEKEALVVVSPNKDGLEKYGYSVERKYYDDGYYHGNELHFTNSKGEISRYKGLIDSREGTLTKFLENRGFNKEVIKELEADKEIGHILKKESKQLEIRKLIDSEFKKVVDPKGNRSFIVDKADKRNYVEINRFIKDIGNDQFRIESSVNVFKHGDKYKTYNSADGRNSIIKDQVFDAVEGYDDPIIYSREASISKNGNSKDNQKDERPSVKQKLETIKQARQNSPEPKTQTKTKTKAVAKGE